MPDDGLGDEIAVGGSAAVLAPTPQLTVTIERLHDRDDIHVHAGGQGIWQARMLACHARARSSGVRALRR